MKIKNSSKNVSSWIVLAMLAVGGTATKSARAGGLILYEIGTPDIGLASAGYAARADDPSTLFKNPAGMSRLEGAQFQGGIQALYGSVSFDHDASTSARLGDDDGGNAVGWLPGGSFFVTMPLNDKWQVGLGTFSNFGLAEGYNNSWVGRYYVERSALVGMSIMPSVSFKATDWLSIGAGLNAMYGLLDTKVGVNNAPFEPLPIPDGQLALKDHTWGFGANVGVLIQASENTRFGITYQSAIDLDFQDTPAFTGLGPVLGGLLANPSQLDLGVTVPQSVMLSGYHALNEKWAVMADVGWQNWNQFGEVEVGVEAGGTTTTQLNFQDTWHGALGAAYHASDKLLLTGGVAFDSSAVDSADRTVTLPMGRAYRFGLGAQYQLKPNMNVGASYTFMWAGDMSVDQGEDLSVRGRVSGSYDSAWFSIASLNMTLKF